MIWTVYLVHVYCLHDMGFSHIMNRGDLAVGVIDNFLFAVGGETKEGGLLDPHCTYSVPVSKVERLRRNHSMWAQEEGL